MADRAPLHPEELLERARHGLSEIEDFLPWFVEYDGDTNADEVEMRWPWRIPGVCNFPEEAQNDKPNDALAAWIAAAPSLVSDLSEALTQSLERERNAVAEATMTDSENPLVQALQEQVETLTAERDRALASKVALVNKVKRLEDRVAELYYEGERRKAAATRRETTLRGATLFAANVFLGRIEGRSRPHDQQEARDRLLAALATTPEPPPAPEPDLPPAGTFAPQIGPYCGKLTTRSIATARRITAVVAAVFRGRPLPLVERTTPDEPDRTLAEDRRPEELPHGRWFGHGPHHRSAGVRPRTEREARPHGTDQRVPSTLREVRTRGGPQCRVTPRPN